MPEADITASVAAGTHSFEDGLDIPAIAPDGQLSTLKSGEAQAAFQNGYRFATYDDAKAWEQRGLEASKNQIYNEGATPNESDYASSSPQMQAFLQSAASGASLGALPYAARKIAGLISSNSDEDLKASQREITTRNPTASILGTVAGATAGIPGIAATAAGSRVAGALDVGEALGGSGALEGGALRAAEIASSIGSRAAGSAVEGAVFNLADDHLSERLIGDPTEVAQNLVASTASSMVLGWLIGAGGAAVGVAAPEIKALATASAGALPNMAQRAAQWATETGLTLAARVSGQADKIPFIRAAVGDQAARYMEAYEGAGGKLAAMENELETATAQRAADAAQFDKNFKYEIRTAPRDIQNSIADIQDQAGGDLGKGMDAQHAANNLAKDTLQRDLATAPFVPGSMYGKIESTTNSLTSQLRAEGGKAEIFAKKLDSYKNAQEDLAGLGPTSAVGLGSAPRTQAERSAFMGAGPEVKVALELRNKAMAALGSVEDAAKPMLSDYIDTLTARLHDHPEYGDQVAALDQGHAVLSTLSDALGTTIKKAGTIIKSPEIERIVRDPAYRDTVGALITQLPEVQPHFAAFLNNADNFGVQMDHAQQISDILAQHAASAGDLTFQQISDFADKFGQLDVAKNMYKLRDESSALAQTLGNPDVPIAAKYAQLMQATGQPLPPGSLDILNHAPALDALAKLRGGDMSMPAPSSRLQQVASVLGKSAFGGTVGGIIGAKVLDDHLGAGVATGAAAGLAAARNPVAFIDTLTKLESMNQAGVANINKGIGAVVDGLSGEGAARVFTNFKVHQTTRDDYKDQVDYITKQAQDPSVMQRTFQDRVGMINGAPEISSALAAQYAKGVTFLASKAQQDPLVGYSINASHSPWAPNDFMLGRWNQYVNAVENPLTVLKSAAQGSVTPEQVEALQTVHPQIYARLQSAVMDAIMEPSSTISYQNRVSIGTLLGIPADATLQPDFVQAMQDKYAKQSGGATQQQNGANPAAPPAVGNKSQSILSQPSDTERVTYNA